MHIKILWVGKTKNSSLGSLQADYLERIRHWLPCDIVEIRDSSRRRDIASEKRIASEGDEISRLLPQDGRVVVLEEIGKQWSSMDFARWLESEQNAGTRTLTFVIGGPDGVSREIARNAHLVLSLGKMTWTHEMSRVLLLEQIYRAICILRNIPYHKGT